MPIAATLVDLERPPFDEVAAAHSNRFRLRPAAAPVISARARVELPSEAGEPVEMAADQQAQETVPC